MPVDYGFNSLSTSGTLSASGISTSEISVTGTINASSGLFSENLSTSGMLVSHSGVYGASGLFARNLAVSGMLISHSGVYGASGLFARNLAVSGMLISHSGIYGASGLFARNLVVSGVLTSHSGIATNSGLFSRSVVVSGILTAVSGISASSGNFTNNITVSGDANISGVLNVGNVLNVSGTNPSLWVYNQSSPGYSYIGFKDTAGSEQFRMIYDANDQESSIYAGNYKLRISSIAGPLDLYAGGQDITLDPDGGSTQLSGRTRMGSNIGITPSSILHIDGSVSNQGSLVITGGTVGNATYLANGNSDSTPFLSTLNAINISTATYGWGFFDRSTDGHFRLRRRNNSTNWTDVLNIARDTGTIGVSGSVGVGTSSPSGAFHVFGSGYYTGNLVVTNLLTSSSGNITTLTTVPTVLSPSALGVDQNDWNPGVGDIIRLSASTTGIDITGMVLRNEYTRVLINIGTANNITLKHQSASSTAANRFITSTGGDHIIPPSGTTTVLYDSVDSRWRIL